MAFVAISTENPLGQRPLNLMSSQQTLGWLGAGPTPGDYDNNQQVLGALVAMGAISQDDANNIWAGNASLDDMAVNMTMINQALAMTGQPGVPTVAATPGLTPPGAAAAGGATIVPYAAAPSTPLPGTPAPAPATPAAAAAAQSPPNSTLTYTVQWSASLLAPLTGASQAISGMQSKLPAYGMSVLSSTTNSLPVIGGITGLSITLTIRDNVGHALLSDIQGVLNSLMVSIVGNNLSGSNLTLASSGAAGAGMPGGTPQPPANLTQWMEQNAGLLAALVIAVVVLPPLIKKI